MSIYAKKVCQTWRSKNIVVDLGGAHHKPGGWPKAKAFIVDGIVSTLISNID